MQVNFKSYQWQGDLLNGTIVPYCDGKAYPNISVVKARRQCGKSIVGIQSLIVAALKKPMSVSAIIEPTWSQSQRIFKQIRKAAGGLVSASNISDGNITLKNGSEICVFSAGQGEGLRGPTVSGILIIDEAAYISDEVYSTVLPWTDVHRAPVILISTPRFKTGFFWDEYVRASSGDSGYALYDWADVRYDECGGKKMTDILPLDRLEAYRKKLPKIQFQCDYLAQFVDAESMLFGSFDSVIIESPVPNKRLSVGIDWSSGSGVGDFTSFVAVNGNGEVIIAKHFNKGGGLAQVQWVVGLLNDLYQDGYRFDRIYSETNNTGSVQNELLRKELTNQDIKRTLREVSMDHDLKIDMVSQLQIAFDSEKIGLVRGECEELIHELSCFESHLTPGGKLTYDGNNCHDDIVIGLCYAWKGYRECNGLSRSGKYTLV